MEEEEKIKGKKEKRIKKRESNLGHGDEREERRRGVLIGPQGGIAAIGSRRLS